MGHGYRHVKALTERRVAETLALLQEQPAAAAAPGAPVPAQDYELIRSPQEYGDLFALGAATNADAATAATAAIAATAATAATTQQTRDLFA